MHLPPGKDVLNCPLASLISLHLIRSTIDKVHSIPSLGVDREDLAEATRIDNIRAELTNCIYLQDSGTNVLGLNSYGTPWQPEYCGWAFNLPRGEACLSKWRQIPEGTDILITHTPPLGYGDHCCTGVRAGCADLLQEVQARIRPKYHVYGHIHEGKSKLEQFEILSCKYIR